MRYIRRSWLFVLPLAAIAAIVVILVRESDSSPTPDANPFASLADLEANRNGEIGSFDFVSEDEASPGRMCREPDSAFGISGRHGPVQFLPSELNKPDLTEQMSCQGGTVVSAWSTTGKRSYYSGTVKVEASPEGRRVELTEFDGHEALLLHETHELQSTPFVYVIQREATEEQPGIFIEFTGKMGRKSIAEAAREIIAETCDPLC